jgi:four helix bundle protein
MQLGYATGPLYEVIIQSVIARKQGFLEISDYDNLYLLAEELSRMQSDLRRSLKA